MEARTVRHSDHLKVLHFGHKAETNSPPQRVSGGKEPSGKAAADDDDARMMLIVGPLKIAPPNQADAQRAQKARGHHRPVCHNTCAGTWSLRNWRSHILPIRPTAHRNI